MQRFCGWAAFLASITSLLLLATAASAGGSPRAIYACFSPENAALIGKLGANDESVRNGFETGQCLALRAGIPLNDVERSGNLWRFRVLGAQPYLYAADWAAGFQTSRDPVPPGFERYLPVTQALLASGRGYVECYDASEKLSARMEDHNRRWKDYQAWSHPKPDGSAPVVTIFVGDVGPRLAAEAVKLREQAAQLRQRCGQFADLQADDDFLAFVRTVREV
jgi:hypothetical protein